MILIIDNYDSFTYNLVQLLMELGAELEVFRNDAISAAQVLARGPQGIVLSPGPKAPAEAEPTNRIIRELGGRVPILGVCLGHQCIAHVYGGVVGRAQRLMHGKTSPVIHDGRGLFEGLPNPFEASRYHSLLVDRATLPPELVVTAWTEEGELMGLRHRDHPLWGVQFHPESILTLEGRRLLGNYLSMVS
jgi:anthranilate synthase component II